MQTTEAARSGRAATRHWAGPADLERLQARLRSWSPDPSGFRARSRTVASAGMALSDWRSTELTGTTVPERAEGALHLIAVHSGGIRFDSGRTTWDGAARSLHVVDGVEDVRWRLAGGSRVQRVTLRPEHLPPHLQRTAAPRSGPLPASRLTVAFSSALEHALDAAAEERAALLHLSRGLQNLAVALLDRSAPEDRACADDLRERIVEHIEHHLSDQALSPRTIADAFSVSLRWVHHSFNTSDTSIARHIRIRRVDAVAEHVRDDRRQPRIGVLAVRFGFSGRDQLARSFRARYGVTIGEYAHLVHEGGVLPTAIEAAEEQAAEADVA